jgi:quercetin dioxygenase-like cupin family protein
VVWSLQGDRQLEANLVVLGPGGRIGEHINASVDVLIVVVGGSATVIIDEVAVPVTLHDLVFVPRLARRAITAGPDGVRYVSTHVARPGLTVGSRPPAR